MARRAGVAGSLTLAVSVAHVVFGAVVVVVARLHFDGVHVGDFASGAVGCG